AAALFPELPCAALAELSDEGRDPRADSSLSFGPAPAAITTALDHLLPVAGGADACPHCGPALRRLQACSAPLDNSLQTRAPAARAHLVAAIALAPDEERPGASRRARAPLEKAVALDSGLTAAWAQLCALYEAAPEKTPEATARRLDTAQKVVAQRP